MKDNYETFKTMYGNADLIDQKHYRNLYVSAHNTFVIGLNRYKTMEEAKRCQKCPVGYIWHSAVCSRNWI